MRQNKIKVLIVDDSALMRKMLTELLSSDNGIEVVGSAQDPHIAREKIKKLKPDVITLDVEMPKMDGLTFLGNLMRLHPMPVIMISSLTEKGADITLEALDLGAVDFVSKPKIDISHSIEEYKDIIIEKVKCAALAKIKSPASQPPGAKSINPKLSADIVLRKANKRHLKTTEKIIAIGASTGGTEAIKVVLQQLPANAPGIVITQHIPELFSAQFAERMNRSSAITVCEAADGQQILPGHAYIAPGSHHLIINKSGARYICNLNDGPPVNRHKPSVDVLFRSVAQNVGPNGAGIILTGMGDDGALGMKEMHDAGAVTAAQDEKTSVVWGMPGEAVKLGGIDKIMPITQLADFIMDFYTS